jgi:hypothetical protein
MCLLAEVAPVHACGWTHFLPGVPSGAYAKPQTRCMCFVKDVVQKKKKNEEEMEVVEDISFGH